MYPKLIDKFLLIVFLLVIVGVANGDIVNEFSVHDNLCPPGFFCPTGAKGDCMTDDHDAIEAATLAAYNSPNKNGTVYFPPPPGGCYLHSTNTWYGVNLTGPPGGGIDTDALFPQSLGPSMPTSNLVILRSMPKQDQFAVADPVSPSFVAPRRGFLISNLMFQQDDSQDASATFPQRTLMRQAYDLATNGSTTITSTNAEFKQGDVGRAVTGTNIAPNSTITSIVIPSNNQQVTQAVLSLATTGTAGGGTISIALGTANSVTTSVGNCVLAMPVPNGDLNAWQFPHGPFEAPKNATWDHVVFAGLSGHASNASCGIYQQTPDYSVHYINSNFYRLQYAYVNAPPTTNQTGFTYGPDFEQFTHVVWDDNMWPVITYNGNGWILNQAQIYASDGPTNYGPFVEAFQSGGSRREPAGWHVTDMFVEPTTATTGQIGQWTGNNHVFFSSGLNQAGNASATVNWDARNSRWVKCGYGGFNNSFKLGGTNNILEVQGPNNSNSWFTNYSASNQILECATNNSFNYNSSRCIDIANSHQFMPVGAQNADFLRTGNATIPYLNNEDMLFLPNDIAQGGSVSYDQTIPVSSSSMHVNTPGNWLFKLANFNMQVYGGTGKRIPLTKAHVCFNAKVGTGTPTQNFNIQTAPDNINFTTKGTKIFTLTTSYATYCTDADLAGSTDPSYILIGTGNTSNSTTEDVAWVAVGPWNGVNTANYRDDKGIYAVPYSAAPVPDLMKGPIQILSATNGTAFTIQSPINVPDLGGSHWHLILRAPAATPLATPIGLSTTVPGGFAGFTVAAPAMGMERVFDCVYDGTYHNCTEGSSDLGPVSTPSPTPTPNPTLTPGPTQTPTATPTPFGGFP